jgi:hypothetical protein
MTLLIFGQVYDIGELELIELIESAVRSVVKPDYTTDRMLKESIIDAGLGRLAMELIEQEED